MMRKRKNINYYIPTDDILSAGKSSIIKWYEYQMKYSEDDPCSEGESLDNDNDTGNDNDINNVYMEATENNECSMDEIDLKDIGLNDEDQALVADILARFSEAKSIQGNVDSVVNQFNNINFEEQLVSSICAPKQSNVDDLIRQAKRQNNW